MRIDHYSLAISLSRIDLQFRILESHKPVKLVIDIGVIHIKNATPLVGREYKKCDQM